MDKFNLHRFIEAQEYDYPIALEEIREGRKKSHWIWYIFPQLKGLGQSGNSNFYGISSLEEAQEYLKVEILKDRLFEICNCVLSHKGEDIVRIMGRIDALKLQSSMTLFDLVYPNSIFRETLNEFYNGKVCRRTLKLLDLC